MSLRTYGILNKSPFFFDLSACFFNTKSKKLAINKFGGNKKHIDHKKIVNAIVETNSALHTSIIVLKAIDFVQNSWSIMCGTGRKRHVRPRKLYKFSTSICLSVCMSALFSVTIRTRATIGCNNTRMYCNSIFKILLRSFLSL